MVRTVEIIREVAKRTSDLYLERFAVENQDAKKPPAVNFIADNFLLIGNELNVLGKSAKGAATKYPAILLFCDQLLERVEPLKQWDYEATLHILIVTDTVDGNGDVKRNTVFYPVLYPIHQAFFDAIEMHPQIYTKDRFSPQREKFDRLGIAAVLGKNRLFADKVDGIEIKNLRLKFKEKKCLTV